MSCLNSGRRPLGQQRRQPGRLEVPEQAVVDEHELGVELDRALDQLALGGHARDDAPASARAGHLQPVGPEVVERAGLEQLVEGSTIEVIRGSWRHARFS